MEIKNFLLRNFSFRHKRHYIMKKGKENKEQYGNKSVHFKEHRNVRGAAERDRALEGRKIPERFLLNSCGRVVFSYTRVGSTRCRREGYGVPSELWSAEHSLSLATFLTSVHSHSYNMMVTARVHRPYAVDGLRDLGIGLGLCNDYR